MMKLALDTSTRKSVMALFDGERTTERVFEPLATQTVIFREMANLLDPDTLGLLDGIIVGTGPGSFTGVKIGVMAANALAWSRNIPLVGVNSLDAVAAHVPIGDNIKTVLAVVVQSTRGEVYLRRYRVGDGRWGAVGDVMHVQVLMEKLTNILTDVPLIITGEAAEQVADEIREIRNLVEVTVKTPSGEGLLTEGLKKLRAGNLTQPGRLVPEYVRVSQAEQKLGGRGR